MITNRPRTIGHESEDDHPDDNWEDRYTRVKGLIDHDDWSKKRKLAQASGYEVSTHCSRECPMPFVAVTASLIRSWRGHMNEVKGLEPL